MKKKSIIENKVVYTIILIILVIGALFGLIQVKNYIGYSMVNASAGYITEMVLDQRDCTSVWGGFYGMAVMVFNYSGKLYDTPVPCLAEQKHLLFSCMGQGETEVYASEKKSEDIEWTSVVAADVSDIDDYLGYTGGERDSANNTFLYNISITIGTTTINAPGMYTKQYNNPNAITQYPMVALKDSTDGTLIFGITNPGLGTKGFNNEDANYQLMLPIRNNTNPRYYFFVDPYDECPEGYGFSVVGEGRVYGYANDNTTGETIEGVEIYISTVKNVTNAEGYYNMTVPYGLQYITAVKDGYEPYIATINVSIGVQHYYNISMVPEEPYLQNGTVQGYVLENETGQIVVNASISVRGVVVRSNSTGEYILNVLEGKHNIVATKTGYDNYINNITVISNSTLEHNISLIETELENKTILGRGTVIGDVKDNTTSEIIPNVSVSIYGTTDYTNSTTGAYLIETLEGTHNIVGIKSGYQNYIGTVEVIEGNITYHNFTMQVYTEPGQGDGLGEGAGAGLGAGQGAGLGAGKGPGTGIIAKVEQPIVIKEFDISVKKILKKLKEGSFIDVPITISNYIEESVDLRFSVEGEIKDMIRMDKNNMVIDGAADGELNLKILANVEPGIYEGSLVVSGDIEEKVPIYVLVLDKERLSVEALILKISPEKKVVTAGSDFKYRVDLQNMLKEEQYKVDLSYSIIGITTNTSIFIEKEDVLLLTSFSLMKKYELPEDLPPGDYQLKVHAEFLDMTNEYATIFKVREPFYKYKFFGVVPLWILLIIGGVIGAGISGFLYYKKKKEEKQRYKIDVNYGELPKPGARSAYVGMIAETTKKTYFDLDQLTIHTLVAGSTGGGKTVSAQGVVEEALMKGAAVMVFDPTVQWTGFLRKCMDKKFLGLYPKFGLKKTDAKAFSGNVHPLENARQKIDFKKFMKPGEINVFVVNKLDTRDYEIFVSNVIRGIFHENMPEAKQLKLIIVFDEFHRLLPKYGGTGEVLIQVERATREFRKWGVGLVLISQVISDFKPEILANINTQIQMRTKDEGDLNRIKEEYGENLLKSLVKASVGAGMVENSSYNKGKPYFVQFRPLLHSTVRLTDEELENYSKYNKIIDDLDYQLEQLEKESVDVFDLRLELKLAQDKVKSGSFNMVNIYLEGLKPRIEAQWEKIGKKPKKKEVEVVSEEELKKELEKAKKVKDKEQPKTQEKEGKKDTKKEDEKIEEEEEAPEKKEEKKEEAKKEVKQEETKKQKEEVKIEIAPIIDEINKLIDEGDKEKLIQLYSELQEVYKQVSKEDKIKIIQEIKLIQQKLAQK